MDLSMASFMANGSGHEALDGSHENPLCAYLFQTDDGLVDLIGLHDSMGGHPPVAVCDLYEPAECCNDFQAAGYVSNQYRKALEVYQTLFDR